MTASIGGSTFYYNFTTTGVLAGNNTAKLTMNMGGNTEKNFNNTANTFTGELTVTGGGTGSATNNNGGRARFRSLADSSAKLIIVVSVNAGDANLNDVVATISSNAAASGKLFGRLKATE